MTTKTHSLPPIRVSEELFNAVLEVAESEGTTPSAMIRDLLKDVFLGPKQYVRVPIVGVIVDDERLGNKIIPFPQPGTEREVA